MVVSLPPASLNPAAMKWARAVEQTLIALDLGHAAIRTNHSTLTRAVGSAVGSTSSIAAEFATTVSRTASAPDGLAGTASAYTDSITGNAYASVVLTWNAPSSYSDGTPMTPLLYEIHSQPPGGAWTFVTNVTTPSATLLRQPFNGGTVSYRVRAQGDNGSYSDWCTAASVTMPGTLAPPAAPSTPTLTSRNGVVTASWDGLLGGAAAPVGVRGVFAETSLDGATGWAQAGQLLQASGGRQSALGPYAKDSTIYVRLRAIDALGQTSSPSATASVVVVGVAGPDIVANSITTNLIQAGQVTSALISTTGLTGITVTGGTLQTAAAANSGIKITGTGLQAFNGSGTAVFTVDGATGAVVANTLTATGATISGSITATGGSITGRLVVTGTISTSAASSGARLSMDSAGITGYNSAGTATLTYLTADGIIKATGGIFTNVQVTGTSTFAGSLSGATGTFAGSLSAATGTFAGSLSAATGTFSGTMSASSIVGGTLDAGVISANSLAVTQLKVADLTNLFENPTFNDPPQSWGQQIRGLVANSNMRVEGGGLAIKAQTTGNADQYAPSSSAINVRPGEAFYMAADMHFLNTAGTGSLQVGVTYFGPTGSRIGWHAIANSGSTKITTAATFDGSWVVPTGTASVQFWCTFSANGEATNVGYIDNLVWRRMADANLVVAGALDATTITGATVTGGTVQTATSGARVMMNSGGLNGYNSAGTRVFDFLTSNGYMTATNASLTSATIVSATITGSITIGSGGGISASNTGVKATLDGNGFTILDTTNVVSSRYSNAWTFTDAAGSHQGIGIGFMDTNTATGSIMGYVAYAKSLGLWLAGNNTAYPLANQADILLGADSNVAAGAFVRSTAVYNRTYTAASSSPGTGSATAFATVTAAGTIGRLNAASVFFPVAYNDVTASGHAAYIGSDGRLGITSSSEKVKNIAGPVRWTDTQVDAWLGMDVHQYAYKQDPKQKQTLGMIAERMLEAGFEDLVYYDREDTEHPDTEIVGFAYERMAVYEHMALQRLYARLGDLEREVAKLRGA